MVRWCGSYFVKSSVDSAQRIKGSTMDTSIENEVQDMWQVRAAAWELAALTFRYPGDDLVGAAASGEWADAAREIAGALGLPLPDAFGEGLPAAGADVDPDALLHALRADATRLFVGAPEPMCSPYEGVWRAADDGVQALLFVNPHSMEVERFCKACGLGRPEGTNEPLDHASAECELLEHLALRAAGAAAAQGAPAGEDLPGGSPEAAYAQFLEEHARTWMPRFAERCEAEAREPLFRAGAQFLAALVAA